MGGLVRSKEYKIGRQFSVRILLTLNLSLTQPDFIKRLESEHKQGTRTDTFHARLFGKFTLMS